MKTKIQFSKTKFAWIASYEKSTMPKSEQSQIPIPIKNLASHLLNIGGERVCIPFEEHPVMCQHFLLEGKEIPFEKLILKKGKQNNCHQNSIHLWRKDKINHQFVTGYALTENDQMWRRHSWVYDAKGNVLETTLARSKYFGSIADATLMPLYEKMYG